MTKAIDGFYRIDGAAKKWLGVCAGIAYYMEEPALFARLFFVLLFLFAPICSILLYFILALITEKIIQPTDYYKITT